MTPSPFSLHCVKHAMVLFKNCWSLCEKFVRKGQQFRMILFRVFAFHGGQMMPMPKFFSCLLTAVFLFAGLASPAQAQMQPNALFNTRYAGAPEGDAAASANGQMNGQTSGQAAGSAAARTTATGKSAGADPMADLLMDVHLTQDKDLWARIRRGFAMPDLQGNLVTSQETWYADRPEYIARMTERSRKYLYHVVEELERRHMPTELALLPFIESAFNPQANSSAQAAGMWQFVPATGRHYDLKQNAFRDDRRDVQASTRAALDYLEKLYGMFGDWQLALAAYNWGEGSVMRAINRNMKAGLGTTYADLSMPAETRNYVPKLQAVKNIVADPARFSVSLPEIPNHPYFRAVPIDRDMDVSVAAKLAEVDVEVFKALNPSAKKSMIVASGTPSILLPWDNADTFTRNLSQYKGPLASYTAWVVPKTMRLIDAARHSGMAESLLRALNHIPHGMLVRGGSTLLVERNSEKPTADISQTVADNAHLDLAPEITMQKAYIRAGRHETVAHLAARYGVSEASLGHWNHVAGSKRLAKGQMMLVMVPTPFGQKAQAPQARYAFAEATSTCRHKGKKRHCAAAESPDAEKKTEVAARSKSKSEAKAKGKGKAKKKELAALDAKGSKKRRDD